MPYYWAIQSIYQKKIRNRQNKMELDSGITKLLVVIHTNTVLEDLQKSSLLTKLKSWKKILIIIKTERRSTKKYNFSHAMFSYSNNSCRKKKLVSQGNETLQLVVKTNCDVFIASIESNSGFGTVSHTLLFHFHRYVLIIVHIFQMCRLILDI